MTNFPLTPPAIDQATIDRAVARGSMERSKAIRGLFRSLFQMLRPAAAPQMAGGKAHA